MAAAVLLALFQAAASTPCSGFYAFIPQDERSEVPFSVEIQPTAVEVLWMDYGNIFARRDVQPDGSLRFNDGQGGPHYRLSCDTEGATLAIDADEHGPARSYRLVRAQTDIWGIARRRGWPIGD